MKKTFMQGERYEAPVTEEILVKLEESILSQNEEPIEDPFD